MHLLFVAYALFYVGQIVKFLEISSRKNFFRNPEIRIDMYGDNYSQPFAEVGDNLWIWNEKNGSFKFKKGIRCVPLHGTRLISRTVF